MFLWLEVLPLVKTEELCVPETYAVDEFGCFLNSLHLTPDGTQIASIIVGNFTSAFSYFKEWVGVILFAAAICCGLVFMLWLVCKLRTQQNRDKVVIAQALAAIEQGASPEIWLSMLKT